MWVYKVFGLAILLIFLGACSPRNIAFGDKDFTTGTFYQALPAILTKNVKIDSVIIYETTFEEKPYEGYYRIDYSEVNAENDKNILHYKPYKGYSQKLYILKLVTEPKDSIAIYFSLKYNPFGQCVGFGPSYVGFADETRSLLYFYKELYTRTKKNTFTLRKSKRALGLYMNANEMLPYNLINIDKMIVEKSFEVGNNVVIDVPLIFRDSAALKFRYLGTEKVN